MKQPFNLSQEKIDQIFWHCILNLSPKRYIIDAIIIVLIATSMNIVFNGLIKTKQLVFGVQV